jgi:hypothetical protein
MTGTGTSHRGRADRGLKRERYAHFAEEEQTRTPTVRGLLGVGSGRPAPLGAGCREQLPRASAVVGEGARGGEPCAGRDPRRRRLAQRAPLRGTPGQGIRLDASHSHDPDGDELQYRWRVDGTASTYPGDIAIADPERAQQEVIVPLGIGHESIHLVLEVRDGRIATARRLPSGDHHRGRAVRRGCR